MIPNVDYQMRFNEQPAFRRKFMIKYDLVQVFPDLKCIREYIGGSVQKRSSEPVRYTLAEQQGVTKAER